MNDLEQWLIAATVGFFAGALWHAWRHQHQHQDVKPQMRAVCKNCGETIWRGDLSTEDGLDVALAVHFELGECPHGTREVA